METLSDEFTSQRQLAIVERFEGFVNYLYPVALNISRAHHIARDRLIAAMFEQVSLFVQAGKSSQVSKLYLADAGLSDLRFLLRRRSVIAAKRKIERYRKSGDAEALSRFVASWRGHAQWANSFNLINRLGVAQ